MTEEKGITEVAEAFPTGKVIQDVNPDHPNLYFILEQGDNKFAVGIDTLLECLDFASKEKYVPKLPDDWKERIYHMYEK